MVFPPELCQNIYFIASAIKYNCAGLLFHFRARARRISSLTKSLQKINAHFSDFCVRFLYNPIIFFSYFTVFCRAFPCILL